jgi:hypothetical protein
MCGSGVGVMLRRHRPYRWLSLRLVVHRFDIGSNLFGIRRAEVAKQGHVIRLYCPRGVAKAWR